MARRGRRCWPRALLAGLGAAVADGAAGLELLPFGRPTRDAYFQFGNGTVYFNHGGYGATPIPVRQAADRYTTEMEAQPTRWFGKFRYKDHIDTARRSLAGLIHANASDLVFLDDASSGMNSVLRSMDWQAGDLLLMIGSVYAVFPNTGAWLEKRYGIRVVAVNVSYPVRGPADYLEPLSATLRDLGAEGRAKVRMALLDHMSSYPPVVVPAVELAELVRRETDALIFVDGAHALGQLEVDVGLLAAAGVHFYVMDGHKWLFSPKGSALLWAAPSVQGLLEPDVISSENKPGTPFQQKYDYIGTRDYSPWCAMQDTLDFRAEALGGESRILAHLRELGQWAAQYLAARWGTEAVAPANMTAGLMALRLPIPGAWPLDAQRRCAQTMMDELSDRFGMQVVVFSMMTPNETQWARISAQVYLDEDDFKALGENLPTAILACSANVADRSTYI